MIQDTSRKWMQTLARLRARADRLRGRASAASDEALLLMDEALELTDTMRAECAALQERVTELERESATRDSHVRDLVDRLPTPVIRTDGAGTIVEANAAAAAILGLSKARLAGEFLLYFCEDRVAFPSLLRQLPLDNRAIRASARLRPRERAPFDAEITLIRDIRGEDGFWLWFVEPVNVGQRPPRTPGRPGRTSPPSESSAH